ncbi:MAG: sugar ABC transporter permease [Candidatus Neomarinimicrobiota bacterium]
MQKKTGRIRKSPQQRKQTLLGYLFVSPWVIGFLIFGLYPIIMSFYYSLCQYDVLRIPQFIGFGNYKELLQNDPYFWKSIWNTLYYTVIRTPLVILGSLLLAVLVNNTVKGIRFFRTIFFIPSIITGVVLSALWLWLLNPQYGLFNSILAVFGIHGPLWLQSPNWSKLSIVLMSLWSIGGGRMLVFLAALQGIPTALYEVVDIDGGGWWAKFRHVTVPMVSPVIFLWTILDVIFSFQVFTEAYVMTKGGPLNSTLFYNLYLYYKAFDDFSMGYASALAWLLLVMILVITLIQFLVGKKFVYYEGK